MLTFMCTLSRVDEALHEEQTITLGSSEDAFALVAGEVTVYVGGQQPGQATHVPSNVLHRQALLAGPATPLSACPPR